MFISQALSLDIVLCLECRGREQFGSRGCSVSRTKCVNFYAMGVISRGTMLTLISDRLQSHGDEVWGGSVSAVVIGWSSNHHRLANVWGWGVGLWRRKMGVGWRRCSPVMSVKFVSPRCFTGRK